MADTGWKFPGTAVGNRAVSGSTSDWSNPDNIKADDASVAGITVLGGQLSRGLAATNFDFSSIPVGATIDGIEIQLGDYEKISGIELSTTNLRLILADGSDGTENKFLDVASWGSIQTDEAGGAADLWTETITRADVQDVDWGWFISVDAAFVQGIGEVDFMQMKVYYTLGGPTPGLGSLTITGLLPLIPPSITSVNAGAAWADGDTNLEIVGSSLI